MKLLGLFSIALATLCLQSCGKTYTCECTNPGGTEKAFTTHCTRSKADKKCADYYDEKFGKIPMNETACQIK